MLNKSERYLLMKEYAEVYGQVLIHAEAIRQGSDGAEGLHAADNTYLIDKRNHTTAALMVQRRTRRTANDFTITELAEEFELSPKVLRDVLKAEGWLMQMDGKGFHYPTLKAPQGALYVEQGAYFSKMTQTVRISPYGVLCVKQLLKDKGLLGWYM